MFKTIAWATDYSPSANSALNVAKELARDVSGRLVIIHVQEITVGRAGALVDSTRADLAALQLTAQEIRDEGIDATVRASRASTRDAAQRILHLAEDAGADVIVIGNRGQGRLATLLLGGVASRLLQIARCPILIAPSERQEAGSLKH